MPVSPLAHQVGGDHYQKQAIQPIEFILANALSFCEGNVVKYVTRWKDKGGIEDLKKARQYLDFLIESVEEDARDVDPSITFNSPRKSYVCDTVHYLGTPYGMIELDKDKVNALLQDNLVKVAMRPDAVQDFLDDRDEEAMDRARLNKMQEQQR